MAKTWNLHLVIYLSSCGRVASGGGSLWGWQLTPGHPLGLWRPLSRKGGMDGISHLRLHAKVTCPLHLLSHPGKDSICYLSRGVYKTEKRRVEIMSNVYFWGVLWCREHNYCGSSLSLGSGLAWGSCWGRYLTGGERKCFPGSGGCCSESPLLVSWVGIWLRRAWPSLFCPSAVAAALDLLGWADPFRAAILIHKGGVR